MEEIIMFIILIGLAIAFIILFVLQIKTYDRHLKETKISILDIACAGSPLPETPEKIKIKNLSSQKFFTKAGADVEFDNYQKFYVRGWSMLLCGIKNGDILFAKPIGTTEIANLSPQHPKVLILKREGQSREEAIKRDDYAKNKIRRTWAALAFNEEQIMNKVEEIINSDIFQELKRKNLGNFLSNEDMKKDCLNNRIAKYRSEYPNCENISSKDNMVIISTTLRKVEGETDRKVFFSIHPARIVVAEAVYSFHKKEEILIS